MRNIGCASRQPGLKRTPCQVVLQAARRYKSSKEGVNYSGRVANTQDLPQKSRAVQRAEVPDDPHARPLDGVVSRWRWDAARWNRGGNNGSRRFQGMMTTIRAGHARMSCTCSSCSIMAVRGKRYKDTKAAQSILRLSTAKASGWRKEDTHGGGDGSRGMPSDPCPRSRTANDCAERRLGWGSVHSVLSGSMRLRASATTLRPVGSWEPGEPEKAGSEIAARREGPAASVAEAETVSVMLLGCSGPSRPWKCGGTGCEGRRMWSPGLQEFQYIDVEHAFRRRPSSGACKRRFQQGTPAVGRRIHPKRAVG